MAILLAVLAHLGYAIGDVFGVVSTRRIGAKVTTFWVYLVLFIAFTPLSLLFLDQVDSISLDVAVVNALLSAVGVIAFLAFTEALRIGNAPLVGAIAGAFPAAIVVLAMIFYGERLTPTQGLAISGIISGIILSSLDVRRLIRRGIHFDRAVKLSLVAMVCWGIYFTFIRTPIENYGWFWANYISTVTGAILVTVISYKAAIKTAKNLVSYIPALAAGLIAGGGTLAFSAAISKGDSSIVGPIAGSYPALFAILTYLIFKEKLTKQQQFGVALTLISIVGLSVVSY